MRNDKKHAHFPYDSDYIIRTFVRRNLDLPKETHYLNMICCNMAGVDYALSPERKKEREVLQILISNTHFR